MTRRKAMTRKVAGQDDLDQCRAQIDGIDTDILRLLNQRAELALKVGDIKTSNAAGADPQFYRPEREADILRKKMASNTGPIADEEIARIFREIMSVCLALEKPMEIAFLGPAGTYTQAAAMKHFGHSVNIAPLPSIDEVFREVEAGTANYGVVPVENSTEGMVSSTLDSFMDSPLQICGEVELRIHHHLLVKEPLEQDKIVTIYSHEQSLAQCRQWLNMHLPNAERVGVSSNAEAARRVAEADAGACIAAIAGDLAAELYGLQKLAEKIEDRPDNTTRFLIIGREQIPGSGQDKTSIIVSSRNKPGALYHLLEPFQGNNVSLTRIETRPSRTGTWGYVFFMDFEGHRQEQKVQSVLDEIEAEAVEMKILGSYPVAVI